MHNNNNYNKIIIYSNQINNRKLINKILQKKKI